MLHPTVVINVVGLTPSLIGDWSPNLRQLRDESQMRTLEPVLPAVTTTVQSSIVTGTMPRDHGIVGNGWFNREYNEVHFWKQSNKLVQSEKVWETARHRAEAAGEKFTCANMFWWYNMYSTADYSVTPRPIYKADGRKIPDCYSQPAELRDMLQRKLGRFPLFNFWGPMSDIKSSQWIAEASMIVHERHDPTLMLIYLPHLDYGLQKYGPDDERIRDEVREIDRVAGKLIEFFRERNVRIMLLSEYGITSVRSAVHVNRLLRQEGSIRVRVEHGLELLDPGASDAFAVADHQIAHVYVRDPNEIERYASFFHGVHGIEQVLDRSQQHEAGLDHARSGDLVLVAEQNRWFSYYYWQDDDRAPDFSRCVDIHRKPGFDPVELFVNPTLTLPGLRIALKLLKKSLGFRMLMDVVPLDASLVRGSHGRIDLPPEQGPLLLIERDFGDRPDRMHCTDVRNVILEHLFNENA